MIPLSARSKVEAALARQAAVALEVEPTDLTRLWLRGGFPDSFLSATDGDSLDLRESFIRTYLERDVPMFGPRIPAETLRRLWTMLAHNQGTLLNASRLASGLSISAPTVTSDIDRLVDLLLELGGQRGTWAVEIKRGLSAKPQRGFYQALEDVQPARAFVVHAGEDSYPISEDIEAIGLLELAELLSRKANEGE